MKTPYTNPGSFASQVDAAQAAYWNGPLSRADAQKIFDQYAQAFQLLEVKIADLAILFAFIMDRDKVTSADLFAFVQRHKAEIAAAEASSPTPAPEPESNLVSLT